VGTTGRPSSTSPTGRVADVYVRNSTALQVGNWRAEYQREEIPKLAVAKGYRVVLWEEEGKSGESLVRRPKMREILRRIACGESDAIACVSLDRLSRDVTMQDAVKLWNICSEAGAPIITPDKTWVPGEDGDDDFGFLQFWMAGRENRRRKQNMYEGMIRRVTDAPMYRGRPPTGYTRRLEEYTDSRGRLKARVAWEIDPEMVEVVRAVFREYPRRTARRLANWLNDQGERWWRKRWKPDGTSERVPWYTNDVIRLVKNPVYMGTVEWGTHAKSAVVKQLLASGPGPTVTHVVPELAIVTEQEWLAAQGPKPGNPERARAGLDVSPRQAGSESILSGLLRCPDCGEKMVTHPSRVRLADGTNYVVPAYICFTYHRVGHSLCAPHLSHERDVLEGLRPVVLAVFRALGGEALTQHLLSSEESPDRGRLEAQRQRLLEAKQHIFRDHYVGQKMQESDFLRFNQQFDEELRVVERELHTPKALPLLQVAALAKQLGPLLDDPHFLPVDPAGPALDAEGKSRRMSDEMRDLWRQVAHEVIETATISHKSYGPRKKADVWVQPSNVVLTPHVREALQAINVPSEPSALLAHTSRWWMQKGVVFRRVVLARRVA
jgi:DNA invertase Pin-like site-specific DNA recombinase